METIGRQMFVRSTTRLLLVISVWNWTEHAETQQISDGPYNTWIFSRELLRPSQVTATLTVNCQLQDKFNSDAPYIEPAGTSELNMITDACFIQQAILAEGILKYARNASNTIFYLAELCIPNNW